MDHFYLGNFFGKAYIWLIPLAILSLASFSIVQNWHTRLKKFKFIAGIRVLQASSASGAQLIMGLSGLDLEINIGLFIQ